SSSTAPSALAARCLRCSTPHRPVHPPLIPDSSHLPALRSRRAATPQPPATLANSPQALQWKLQYQKLPPRPLEVQAELRRLVRAQLPSPQARLLLQEEQQREQQQAPEA